MSLNNLSPYLNPTQAIALSGRLNPDLTPTQATAIVPNQRCAATPCHARRRDAMPRYAVQCNATPTLGKK